MEKWFRTEFTHKLRNLYELLSISENAIINELMEAHSAVEKQAEEIPKELLGYLGLSLIGLQYKLAIDLPNLLRQSIFSSLYFLFESTLDSLASYMREKYFYELGPKDLRDQGIQRSQNYIKKVIKVSFPDQTEEWRKLIKYSKIRHVFAHSGGEVSLFDQSEFEKEIKGIKGISIDHKGLIHLDESFCMNALHTIDQFMKNLFTILDEEKPHWEKPPDFINP
jgi:hypothetical protein